MRVVFKTRDNATWAPQETMVKASTVLIGLYGAPRAKINLTKGECKLLTHAWTQTPTLLWEAPLGARTSLHTMLNVTYIAHQLKLPIPRCFQGFDALLVMVCVADFFEAKHLTVTRHEYLDAVMGYSMSFEKQYPTVFRTITDRAVPDALLWSCEATDDLPRDILARMLPPRDMIMILEFSCALASLYV